MTEKATDRDPLAVIFEETWRGCRSDGMSIAATADMLAAVFREQVLDKIGEKENEGLAKPDHVMVLSIVGAATGQPLVQFRAGFEQWQWDIEHAREHALYILAIAEAAVHDAAMLRWLTIGRIGMAKNDAFQAIAELRRFRGDVEREDWIVPDE